MTQEQYKRACQIKDRLTELADVKKRIEGRANEKIILSYLYCSGDSTDYSQCNYWCMRYIADILDKHDKMIREEIDAEIESLKKEIEML
jgi:hypothetical protein